MGRSLARRTVENALARIGLVRVAGVDEVGRGCLAGPVVAGAGVLDPARQLGREPPDGGDARALADDDQPRVGELRRRQATQREAPH